MSYRLYRFGASQLIPVYEGSQDIGTGLARIESVDAPRGGAFDSLGKEQAFRGGYEVSASGLMVGSSAADLKTQFDALRAYLGKREKLWRIDDSGGMQWVWARLTGVNVTRQVQHRQFLEMDLSFYIYSALWHGTLHGSWRLDDGYALDTVNLVLDTDLIYALTSGVTTITINNGGNGVLCDFEFAITPVGSAITAIKLEIAGKTSLTWSGSVAVSTQLVINFGAMGISNNGVNAYSGLTLTTDHKIDDWMRLEAGDNTVVVTRTGGDATSELAVVYYDGWV